VEESGLVWLRGDGEKKQGKRNARTKKKDNEEVEITVTTKEKEEDGKAEKRGRLWIPKTMQR